MEQEARAVPHHCATFLIPFETSFHTTLLKLTLWLVDATFSGERLREFYIRVGNVFDEDNFDPFTYDECWYQSDQLANAETREFTCHQVLVGRYVAIHHSLNVSLVLTLCEVQVYSDLGNEYVLYNGCCIFQ